VFGWSNDRKDSRGLPSIAQVVCGPGASGIVEPNSGELWVLPNVINDQIRDVRFDLNELANAVVTEINAIHQSSVTSSGVFSADFFDPLCVFADSIKLASSVHRSPNEVAAGTTGAPGDGSVTLSIAGLCTAGVASLDGISIHERYTRIVTMVGARVADTERLSSPQDVGCYDPGESTVECP